MYLKTAVILACLVSSYASLVFAASAWWQAVPLAALLGLAMAAVSFNVQHDGNHHAYSRRPWVNRLMATSLDLMGASSYFWHWKHDVIHHTYVNIAGQDTDIDTDGLARLSPHQRLRAAHRWQHYYMWLLYGLMTVRWQLHGDFRDLVAGRVADQKVPRPRGPDLAVFLGGKAAFLSLVFAVPMLLHPAWVVLLFYGATSMGVGVLMAVVFQLAHCVEHADFPLPRQGTGRLEKPWAIHQVETAVNFGRGNRALTWFLGGLNFQIEHHLLPRVCHVNYPAIAPLVEQTCREFGVRYAQHDSLLAGLRAHFLWLRRMGRAGAPRRGASPHTVSHWQGDGHDGHAGR
jgi:linoleoyl-CoA desaturase